MKRFALIPIAVGLFALPALADTKPSAEDAKKISEAAAMHGFVGGTAEREDEGSGIYELDDAKGKDGLQYDLKFDKDFKLLSVTRD